MDITPDGSTVVVAGGTDEVGQPSRDDFATVAYSTADGTDLWFSRYEPGSLYNHPMLREPVLR
ncbi:MAG: hypothetical protein ABR518_05645, partial [Actinomycetota bacterium]